MGVENINRITLSGRVTKGPELSQDSGGTPILTLRLAYLRRRGNGAQRVETQYVDVVCRGPLALQIAREVERGSRIYVDGKLDFRAWTDQCDGRSRQVHRVDAGTDPASVHCLNPRPTSRGRMP